MEMVFHEAASRGFAKHDWLTTHHSFSFASYYDPNRMGFGALRVLNDDVIAPASGFGRHPHNDMEIITIPLSGSLKHEDSMGNSAVITTGEVQVMSAGTGVEHAEWNASETEALSLFQIWIVSAKRGVVPRYDQRHFAPEEYQGRFLQVVGLLGEEGVLGIHQDASVSLGRFAAGTEASYELKGGQGLYLLVIDGAAQVAGKTLASRDAVGVWDTNIVSIQSDSETFFLAVEVPM